jgi:AraC-like DNA-binding protein
MTRVETIASHTRGSEGVGLRYPDEGQIDVRFECGPNGTIKRSESQGGKHMRLETISGQVQRTVAGTVAIPGGYNALAFNTRGTLLLRIGQQGKMLVVPPKSATFIRGAARIIVQAARGEHSVTLMSWPQALTPMLDAWVANATGARTSPTGGRQMAVRPIDPHLRHAYERFEAARMTPEKLEPMMLSAVYEITAELVSTSDQVQLAAIPTTLPETIKDLTVEVHDRPAHPWPLRDAADRAGYSPFHFSRVFKQMVGYGFHEFVDRVRTEAAVEMLCNTDSAVDLVASACGFGTTQGLRESVKEYLGLVPSELRSIPDVNENHY